MRMFAFLSVRLLAEGTKHICDHLHVLREGYLLLVLQLTNTALETHFLTIIMTMPVG